MHLTHGTPSTVSRRALLAGGTALGGAMLLPAPSASAVGRQAGTLTGSAVTAVDPNQFVTAAKLYDWQDALNDIGLRATGSSRHHAYVDRLAERMAAVGIRNIRTEAVPLKMWTPSSWSLDLVGGSGAGPLPVSWYIPYSGATTRDGVVAPLSAEPAAGTIGLISVETPALPYPLLDLVDYDTPVMPTHGSDYDPLESYSRAWLTQDAIREGIAQHKAAGAVGVVVILDLPAPVAKGQYAIYDGILRDLPGVIVDRDTGARLTAAASGGGQARLKLVANVVQTTTPNLYGFIPGASEELVIIQTHTDGTNGIEENGPEPILAMAQYLSRIPRAQLPRTILVLMSTGHMAGNALGTEAFLRRHQDDLVDRTAAAMSLEHFGARSWLPTTDGEYVLAPGYETNIVFASPHNQAVRLGRQAQTAMAVSDPRVLRPYATDKEKISPNGRIWPGDGQGLWRISGLPSVQSIAGPNYLLSSDFDCMPYIDISAMRRQAIAWTDIALSMTRTPWSILREERIDDPLWSVPLELVNTLLL
jgi:hypothetical protein